MEIELNKKTEAVLTLSNLLRTEKMKNGELINDYRTLELAYQKLQMNMSPPSINTNYSDLKNELVSSFCFNLFIYNKRNNNNFVPQFGGNIQNQNNNPSLNQSQSPTNPIQNQMQTNTQEPIYYQQQSQTFGKPQTQTQSLNQSQIQSNSQVQTQSYPQNQSSVQGQGLYQPNIQNHNQSGGQNQVSSIPQANNQAQTSSQIQPQLQTQEMSQPNTQNQILSDTQAQVQGQGQVPTTTQTAQANPIFNQSQFPPLSELPEAVRIALQGSIKTLLQVQSTSPIKSSGAQSNAQTSASPSTTATSKKK